MGVLTVSFKQRMYNHTGEEIDSTPFVFGVDLDELDSKSIAKLNIKPFDNRVLIARDYYDMQGKYVESDRCECFETPFLYYEDKDELILDVFNGFDVALFNISALLGIGRVEIADEVPCDKKGFAPVHDKVRRIKWTLEEFKQLDGHVALIKFKPYGILFKGLLIGANYIRDDVYDGDRIPNLKSSELQRGENLFILE